MLGHHPLNATPLNALAGGPQTHTLAGVMTGIGSGACALVLSYALVPQAAAGVGAGACTLTVNTTHALAGAMAGVGAGTCVLTVSFPAGAFSDAVKTEMAKFAGARPVTLLRFQFLSGDLFVGDADLTIADWGGAARTIKGWVADWGKLDDVAQADLSGTPILAGDLSVTVLVPGGREGTDSLWSRLADPLNQPERTPVELYLWWRNLNALTDPPVRRWAGVIKDWRWRDPIRLELLLADDLERYDRAVSRPITTTNFPNCDPDDVGKLEPVLYGQVAGVPCAAIDAGPNSTLVQDVSASDTKLYYSEPDTPFAASGQVFIDSETIAYNVKTTEVVGGLTYGVLSGLTRTAPVAHAKGAAIVQAQSAYKYLVAGHPCKAVDRVYVEDERGHPVLQPASSYTVNLADTSFPDGIPRATIIFSAYPKLVKQVNVQANDTIAVQDGIGVSDTIGGSINAKADLALQNTTLGLPQSFALNANGDKLFLSFAAPGGSPNEYDYTVDLVVQGTVNNGAAIYARHTSGGSQVVIASYLNGVWTTNGAFFLETPGDTLAIGMTGFTAFNGSCQVNRAQRKVLGPGTWTKSGTAAKTGAATKAGTVTVVGNSAADTVIGGLVTCDVQGYADDSLGTYSGVPNALLQQTAHVLKHFAVTHLGLLPTDFQTAPSVARMGSTYQINGCITEPVKARLAASRMAFESGCWFKFVAGKATLIFRERLADAEHTFTSDRLWYLGEKQSAEVERAPLDWIVNKLDLRYQRDWRKPRGADAYRAIVQLANPASQAKFNVRERPDLFLCDFIMSAAQAQAVAQLYLDLYGVRRELTRIATPLHYADVAFGDRARIQDRMQPARSGEIISADFVPGSAAAGRMPTLEFLLFGIEEAETMLSVLDKSANYTVMAPDDCERIITNKGATGVVTFTLPPATRGQRYIFYRHDAFNVRVDPNGSEIFVLTFTSGNATDKTAPTPQAAGKYLEGSSARALLEIVCVTDGEWLVRRNFGTWTIEV